MPFTLALHNLWPHTLLGCAALGLLAAMQPAAIPYALFLAGGPALAIPFAMMTAWPSLGSFAARVGIGRLPEETASPAVLLDLGAAGDPIGGAVAQAERGLSQCSKA